MISFSITEYLESKHIEFKRAGYKNVSRGWIEISCPFCASDPSFHCGINLKSELFNCWRCSAKGGPERLVMKLEKCSLQKAQEIIKQFSTLALDEEEPTIPPALLNDFKLPACAQATLPNVHKEYLLSRGFDPFHITSKYRLKFCHLWGDYKFRIIVPIYQHHQLVCFTTRDVTGQAIKPYVAPANDKVLMPLKSCIYNLDSVTDCVLIMEGVFDVWRLDIPGAVSTFGEVFTTDQINALRRRKLSKAVVMYDAEPLAQSQAEKLAGYLDGFVPKVEIYELEQGDPAEQSADKVKEILDKFLS